MPETKHTQENLAYIRTHVDNLERMVRFQIAANPASHDAIRRAFSQRKGMAEVYLALEASPLGQEELAVALNQGKPNISKILSHLHDAGMVEKSHSADDPKKSVYRWTDLEVMLQVSRLAREVLKKQPRPPTAEHSHDGES